MTADQRYRTVNMPALAATALKENSMARKSPTVVAESTATGTVPPTTSPEAAPLATTAPTEARQLAPMWEQKLELVRSMCCQPKNRPATDAEFALFLHQCRTRRLDPLARQIYCVFRNTKEGNSWAEKMTIQTSIDGFRLIAQRTGEYRGQCGPWWCGEDGQWRDVWTAAVPPTAAKVGVWREGFKEPLMAVARFDSYAQTFTRDGRESLSGQWAKMSDLMISKCAEALALRRAFPDELSGIYTSDEMAQADNDAPPPATKPQDEPKARPTPEAAPAPAPAANGHAPQPPASVKQRLWGAISIWTGVPTSQAAKLAEAGKHIYAYHKVEPNAKATEEDLAKMLKWVTEQQSKHVAFEEWLADRLERRTPSITNHEPIQESDIPW